MIVHDLKIAYRNLSGHKLQSLVCMLGLAVGLACFSVCSYMLRQELAWNKRLPYFDDTYILVTIEENGQVNSLVGMDLAGRLKEEFPEIEKKVCYISISGVSDKLCVVEGAKGAPVATKADFLLTDCSFFDFYDFRLITGNKADRETQPNTLILSLNGARTVFGTPDAVGKVFTEVDDFEKKEKSWMATALMEDFPSLTDFGDMAGVILQPDEFQQQHYRDYVHVRYRLQKGTSWEELNRKIARFMEKHPELRKNKPLTVRIWPYKDFGKLLDRGAVRQESLAFAGVGLLVLLAALFNYVLYAAGRMFNRQKELGIREINGATSGTLLGMFMTEVTLTLVLTGLIAAAIMELLAGYFQSEWTYYMYFAGKGSWLGLMGLHLLEYLGLLWILMLGIGYGIIRKVRHTTLLRNLQGGGIGYHARMQTLLLTIQLVICMFLIGLTWFMQAQQKELETKMAGRLTREELENIYQFNLNGESLEAIRQNMAGLLAENPWVESWCRSGTGLLSPWTIYPDSYRIEGMDEEKRVPFNYNYVDPNYPDFIHARIEKGRFFKAGEPDAMVVNRSFAEWLGEDPIGKTVFIDHMAPQLTYRIVGIIEDILPVTDAPEMAPGIYMPYPEPYINETLYVKFKPGFARKGIQPLKARMEAQVSPFTPLYIENLWMDMRQHLSGVIEIGSLICCLAIICIIISALGVYSSMMLAVEKRSREMAIRKINGAALGDIAGIFCLHYLKLAAIAAAVAFPLIYWTMSRWLETYSCRITLSPGVFVAIFLLMLLIISLTILSQLLKIVHVNPTKTLKND